MEDKILVANWKAYQTLPEAISWVETIGSQLLKLKKTVILCPPVVFILPMSTKVQEKGLSEFLMLGSQNVSQYPGGAYTGEVSVEQLSGLVKFTIVGHSERRKYFGETDQDVIKKVKLLLDFQITPVLCISNLKQLDVYLAEGEIISKNSNKIIFVYEPPAAISGGGSYHPETPENANDAALKISQRIGERVTTLYGGSINPENVSPFFSQENIDGGLIGQASLEPATFIRILAAIK